MASNARLRELAGLRLETSWPNADFHSALPKRPRTAFQSDEIPGKSHLLFPSKQDFLQTLPAPLLDEQPVSNPNAETDNALPSHHNHHLKAQEDLVIGRGRAKSVDSKPDPSSEGSRRSCLEPFPLDKRKISLRSSQSPERGISVGVIEPSKKRLHRQSDPLNLRSIGKPISDPLGSSAKYDEPLSKNSNDNMPHIPYQTSERGRGHDQGRSSLDENDSVPPLVPGFTTSPPLDIAPTPRYGPLDQDISPTASASPIRFPSLPGSGTLPSPRPEVRRASSYNLERIGSGRYARRRTSARSTRSGSVAKSPASSWLSMWKEEPGAPLAKPDDEGQLIGDHDQYVIGKQVGFGGFSIVKEAQTFENDQPVVRAVKIVRKHVDGRTEQEDDELQLELQHEIAMWRLLKHPNILELVEEYCTSFATFCFTQMTSGGTLFEFVRRQRQLSADSMLERSMSSINEPGGTSHFPRAWMPLRLAKRYLFQLASALKYLHLDMKIVHRDIKLENCLLDFSKTSDDADGEGNLLLCDFGMAEFLSQQERVESYQVDPEQPWQDSDESLSPQVGIGPAGTSTSITGSLQYASPELIKAGKPLFNPSVDMWAYGVVSHALLTAELPFTHHFLSILQTMILRGDWDSQALMDVIHQRYSGSDGNDANAAIELTLNCLNINMAQRWSVTEVLDCEFLGSHRAQVGPLAQL